MITEVNYRKITMGSFSGTETNIDITSATMEGSYGLKHKKR